MDISFLGHSCFLLKGRDTKVVTDPYGSEVGWQQSKVEADIVTVSHEHKDHNDLSKVEGEPMVIAGPGEYEIKGVSVTGISVFHDDEQGKERGKNTIYAIDIDGLRVCHMGDLGHKLNDKQLDLLDGIDVLMMPVGGFYTVDPKQAAAMIKQISPIVLLPMHFKDKGMKASFDKLITLDKFLQMMDGDGNVVKESKLSLKKTELTEEEMKIVILERK